MGQDLSLPKLPSGVYPTLPEAISQIILELNTSLSDEKRLSEFTYLYSFVKELRSNTSLIQGIDSVNTVTTELTANVNNLMNNIQMINSVLTTMSINVRTSSDRLLGMIEEIRTELNALKAN